MKGSVASVAIFIVAISTAKLYADCNEYKVEQFEGRERFYCKMHLQWQGCVNKFLCQCPHAYRFTAKNKDEFQPHMGVLF